jgi:hypothetical protein
MDTKYYQKSGLGRMAAIQTLGGNQPRWEQVGPDVGVLATSNSFIIEKLDECVKRRWAGVRSITQEQYEEKKTNPNPQPPRRKVTTSPETNEVRLMPSRMFSKPPVQSVATDVAQGDAGDSSSKAEPPSIAVAKTPTAGKAPKTAKPAPLPPE